VVGIAAQLSAAAVASAVEPAMTQGVQWGESSSALQAHFGARARPISPPIDFGDSYAALAVRDVRIGGVPLVAFLQIDKATGGLKRIQLERQRHGVNPPAFRAVLGALHAAYGNPAEICGARAGPADGYQAASQYVWRQNGSVIRAIFRDTTIEAFEGCLTGDPGAFGPCGLTGQLLIRISPPNVDPGGCTSPPRP
jgi:hypothetical protein